VLRPQKGGLSVTALQKAGFRRPRTEKSVLPRLVVRTTPVMSETGDVNSSRRSIEKLSHVPRLRHVALSCVRYVSGMRQAGLDGNLFIKKADNHGTQMR
jgi:hypothetical protein